MIMYAKMKGIIQICMCIEWPQWCIAHSFFESHSCDDMSTYQTRLDLQTQSRETEISWRSSLRSWTSARKDKALQCRTLQNEESSCIPWPAIRIYYHVVSSWIERNMLIQIIIKVLAESNINALKYKSRDCFWDNIRLSCFSEDQQYVYSFIFRLR